MESPYLSAIHVKRKAPDFEEEIRGFLFFRLSLATIVRRLASDGIIDGGHSRVPALDLYVREPP